MKIVWTSEALGRLREIKRYISMDGPNRASIFIKQLIEHNEVISQNPRIGRIVPEISNPEIRELLYKNYRIVYKIQREYIEILTVFEGHMLLRIGDMDTKWSNS